MRGLTAMARWWLPALLLVILNLVALAGYHLVFAERVEARVARFDRSTEVLQRLRQARQRLEARAAGVEAARTGVQRFYSEYVGSQDQRLTRVLAEIKDLARAAGLEPSTIAYESEALEGHGLLRRRISFAVSGRYMDLRRLINLLELSDSFITLDRVQLSEGSRDAALRINLQLSTLFSDGMPSLSGPERPAPGRSG